MANYLQRARSVLHEFLRGRRAPGDSQSPAAPPSSPHATPVPAGNNLVVAGGRLAFVDPARAGADPGSWLDAFEAAVARNVPLSESALAIVRAHAARVPGDALLSVERAPARLLDLLRPRAGLSDRLREMHRVGLLGALLPEAGLSRGRDDAAGDGDADPHSLLTVQSLERLLVEPSLAGERFGSMLRELNAPELLVLTLLLHDADQSTNGHDSEETVRTVQPALDRLQLHGDARRTVEFLLRNQLQMSLIAFRQDTRDPAVIGNFGALFSTEEHLKMLCLITVADLGAMGRDTLTPWKAEVLWRLFVDTYNHLTLGYGDELIEPNLPADTDLLARRPPDLTEAEITHFLAGLPRRYLQLFEREAIYRHVRLSRNIHPDEVHSWLEQKGSSWELTVVTLDKPFLFSNISGVLSSFGMDILRGHAMTNPNGLVLDVFQFTDQERFLELNADAREQMLQVLDQVVSGRANVTARLRGREDSLFHRRAPRVTPVVHCDNQSSRRYTILDIIADDALGLLYRISRVMSQNGCEIDLVLIATEGQRAIDVFHITNAGSKLSDADQQDLAAHLQRMLEGSHETH